MIKRYFIPLVALKPSTKENQSGHGFKSGRKINDKEVFHTLRGHKAIDEKE